MHFPEHWIKVKRGGVVAWGWSDHSPDEARTEGEKRLDRIIAWLARGQDRQVSLYGYSDRPMREEVLQEFQTDGKVTAAITRNSYGCLVLNSTNALFVDVDEPAPNFRGLLGGLFGKKLDFTIEIVNQARQWIVDHPSWAWRIYRTRAGLRLLATHTPINPDASVCAEVFKAFQADRLYQKLCRNQQCFRARLSPKPWRCGLDKPVQQWPWSDAAEKEAFQKWDIIYQKAGNEYATCHLIGQYGRAEPHPALADLVRFHDTATRAESKKELA